MTCERGQYPLAFVRVVSEGYPAAMGIPFLAGRDFSASDMAGKEPVMLVNKTLADALWPGADPIGQHIVGPCAKERRVVGVLGDVRHLSLEQPSGNEMHIPARQCDDLAGSSLVVRSTLPAGQVALTLRAALTPIAPNLAGNDVRTLQQIVDRSVSPRRFTVLLLGRLCPVRAGPGLARHLCADLIPSASARRRSGFAWPSGRRRATCERASSGRRFDWR